MSEEDRDIVANGQGKINEWTEKKHFKMLWNASTK